MKGFDVLKVKSAVKDHNKFDLSRTHLTTAQFGEIIPLLAEETVPGDQFNVNAEYFSRLAPLVKPTYGKFQFKTVAGYVPYHMLAADADAWFAGKTTWEGTTPHQRYFTLGNLHKFVKAICVTSTGATSANTVYTYVDSGGTFVYNVFTPVGKYYVKVLNALGYALPSNVDEQSGSTWLTTVSTMKLSAFPLLAYFKLYNDYMSNSVRFNTAQLSKILNDIKYIRSYSQVWNVASGEILDTGLAYMFQNLFLCYENDYFISAWQSPNNPLNAQESVNSTLIPAGGSGGGSIAMNSTISNDRVDIPVISSSVGVSQRVLDFLKSFDDWVRRNNYAGSRAVQQIYAKFGIKTSDYRDHYANVLSVDSMPVMVGDVTATADAGGVPLGDYAGKGIVAGEKGVSCKADDYGILLILGYFTVTPMNAFGYDRKVLRTDPLDYYNAEFDGLGADAISVGEFFADPTDYSTNGVYDNSTYGFTERYNAYRYGRDQITGEFRDYSPAGLMNCWHAGRNMSAIRRAGNLVAQNNAVVTMPQYDSEYNRIFAVTSGSEDKFYLTAKFNFSAIRPMLNLNQVVNLGVGDTTVPRNGNTIS